MLTGDTLFVGDIARPDLAVDKEEGARGIFRSLHDALLTLPDTCEVWPGHLGGSLCGGPGMDLKVSSTIGFERARQPLLQVDDEDEFVRARDSRRSARSRRTSSAIVDAQPRAAASRRASTRTRSRRARSSRRSADGALVVDVRTELQFDEAHIPGAVCITARRAGFGSKLAWVAEPGQPIVLVGRDDEDALRGRRARRRGRAARASPATSPAA